MALRPGHVWKRMACDAATAYDFTQGAYGVTGMILGMTTLTFVHVVLSLIGIVSGLVVVAGLLRAERRDGWTALFLLTTLATSATGFALPADSFLPSHGVGIISLVVLAAAIVALYVFRLAGSWRWIYVISAVAALYFNVFVLVVQLFRKIPALHALAPTESELPFAIAQGILLVAFVILAIAAVRGFRGGSPLAA
jgi:hypothetical protein